MTSRRIRVLQSIAPPEHGKTRFIDHLIEGAAPGVSVQTFTWRAAFRGQYDVFHVHWPERLLRKGWAKTFALLALLRLRRIPIVRTLHNIDPHESGSANEAALLRMIDRQTSLFIRLNDHTPVPTSAPVVTVAHPHYLPRVNSSSVAPVSGRILYFGIVRPYKGVKSLLEAFAGVEDPSATLRIVGSATGDRGDDVRAAAKADRRVTATLEYVADATLDEEISAAELVVLPYRKMHNSGALFLALSHGRRVLVPRSEVNEDISREVGSGWILQFDGEIDGNQLSSALAKVRTEQPARPVDLNKRDWSVLGIQLRHVYEQALSTRK